MDQKISSTSDNILPAQLLHQKLLNYQQNVDDTLQNNGEIDSLPLSNPRFLNGRLSLLESSLNMQSDCGIEKDDDDDVTIPGQFSKLSLQNSTKYPSRNLSLTSPVLVGSKMSQPLTGTSKPGINNGLYNGNELPSLNDRAVIVRSSGASRRFNSSSLIPKGLSLEVEPINGITKSPNREEKIKRNHKSLDRHTPLPLPENLIRSSEQRCPPPVPPSTAEGRAITPMPSWETIANNCSNDVHHNSDKTANENDNNCDQSSENNNFHDTRGRFSRNYKSVGTIPSRTQLYRTPSQTGGNTYMADLGSAPPIQQNMEEEDRRIRTSSGKTGSSSPPNLLALTQYYTERKTVLCDIPHRKDKKVTSMKTLKSSATTRATPIQMLSSISTQSTSPRGNISLINVNRPRKLTPMDPQNHRTLAMAVEESHHRFLGSNKISTFDKTPTDGLTIQTKRGGAKRGGAGYAAAASRALQIPSNISIPITPANSPQGSRQSLHQVSGSITESNIINDEEVATKFASKGDDEIADSESISPTHNLLRKNTFSMEEPSKFEFSQHLRKLEAIVP